MTQITVRRGTNVRQWRADMGQAKAYWLSLGGQSRSQLAVKRGAARRAAETLQGEATGCSQFRFRLI